MTDKTLLLIDGHALAYRYYFAFERFGFKSPDGRPTWAVYGFFECLFDMLKETKANPDLIAVTFDVGRVTFRTEMFSEYKANREAMPDAMHSQLEEIVRGLNALNIPICTKVDFEADDVIGTITERAKAENIGVMILTGDRDSFQLVDDVNNVTVIMPSKGQIVTYDSQKVFERMGVYPEQITDLKGLAGDTSDNIPGIRGIGDKTAAKLLSLYKNIDGIYENIDSVSGKSLKQKLIDGKDDALLSKKLATICRDVPIDFDFKNTCMEFPDQKEVLNFFMRNGLRKFTVLADSILSSFKVLNKSCVEKNESVTSQSSLPNGQLGLFASLVEEKQQSDYNIVKTVIDTKDKLISMIDELKTQTLISIDTETTGLNPLEDDLVGISIAYNKSIGSKNNRVKIFPDKEDVTRAFYIPVFHSTGEQLEIEELIQTLSDVFADESIKKTMQNAKFDLHVLRRHSLPVNGLIFDTMLAGYVADSSDKHGLKFQAAKFLNYYMKEFETVAGKFQTFDSVDIETAADYACDDAFATLELSRFHCSGLSDKELDLLYDTEVPTELVLTLMEQYGVSVDTGYLKQLSLKLSDNLALIEKDIYEKAGETFNINSPKQVADILFGKLGLLPKGKKSVKAGQSTNAKILEDLSLNNKIASDILQYRHLSKLKSTYIDALPLLISPSDGRIHTSFNQTVTTTGRLSSSNPNLQNIPVRTQTGAEIRKAFVPENRDTSLILSADYSQIELRLMAHCSQDENLMSAFNDDIDVHTLTAAKVYGVSPEEVTKEMRSKAKTVNFGIVYGQSKYGLASSLGISLPEAENFIAKYFMTYPGVRDYMYETIDFARRNGYVETIFGRKRILDTQINSSNGKIREAAERAAVNAPLQGSAADLIKIAMVNLQKSISGSNLSSKIIIQVHDELVIEMLKSEQDTVIKLTKEAMEAGQPLTVPLKVDIAVSSSFGEF